MTADEAWRHIVWSYKSFRQHDGGMAFIPKHPDMIEMFELDTLTDDVKRKYRDIFINKIYNEKDLKSMDPVIAGKAVPALQEAVKTLAPMTKKWGIEIPALLDICTTYGSHGTYNHQRSSINLGMSERTNEDRVPQVLLHEFIHLLIEGPIILKLNVPANFKERIVDLIGVMLFNMPELQPKYKDLFVDKYITREAIEGDLPAAVQQMMTDWTLINANEIAKKSLG